MEIRFASSRNPRYGLTRFFEGGDMNPDAEKETQDELADAGSHEPSSMERNWAMGCHLAGLCGIVIPVPFGGLVATMLIWLLKREEGPFIDDQGKEALNFQMTILIYVFGCIMLIFIGIGILLLFPLILYAFICIVIAAVKASEGVRFRYPGCIHFIK